MTRIPTKLKRHAHTQMARELGMNPRKLGSIAGGGQEPWKRKCCNFIVFRCENGSTNLLHTFGVLTAVQHLSS